MARRSSTTAQPAGMRSAFMYAPGDHHQYTWDGVADHATVTRIVITDGVFTGFDPTGDTVPMEGVTRTATAFMDAIDGWRASR